MNVLYSKVGLTSVLCGMIGISGFAQNVDSSANSSLSGAYAVRQVFLSGVDQTTSAIGRARSIIGIMTFDGNGKYTFTGQMCDTNSGSTAQAYSSGGIYSVGANGLAEIQSPIDSTDTEYGGVGATGPSAVVASATEGSSKDIFIAIPVGSNVTNGALSGTYWAGFEDFLGGNASQVHDGYYMLTADGKGNFGDITVAGAMANQGSTNGMQNLTGVTYTAAGGVFTFNFPSASSPLTVLVSGPKSMYISADGNLLVGGSPNGFDVIAAIPTTPGVPTGNYQGTYFTAGLENVITGLSSGDNAIDSFYGSNLALGEGNTIYHERQAYYAGEVEDISVNWPLFAYGQYFDGIYEALPSVSGQAYIQVGTKTTYSLTLGIQANQYSGLGVFIDPLSIFNAASYAPITNPVAPGEFVSIFGSGLASTTASAQSLPLPARAGLGGVQVMVNGRYAPLSYVSPTQINLLVPNATGPVSGESYATFQVINNNEASNKVTVHTNYTAPGAFSLTSNGGTYPPGIGPAAVLHADYSLVTPSNPAKAGETLQLYLTGLGSVTPSVADGAAASTTTLSVVDGQVAVYVGGVTSKVAFAGLAPGFAGLYQINFVVPSGITTGTSNYLIVITPDGETAEAKLYT
jgi:uncharacterized protein (TIGR03437 family)